MLNIYDSDVLTYDLICALNITQYYVMTNNDHVMVM